MNQLKTFAAIAVIGMSVTGCSIQSANTAPKPLITKPVPVQAANPWQQRQVAMNNMQTWEMNGRAALNYRGDGWTFGLGWFQKNRQHYVLQIKNPVTGTIVGVVEQSPGKAVLKTQGRVYNGTDAEKLLEQQMRVKMPVNGMPYWVRGVMAPQYPVGSVKHDAQGRPSQITQAGWVVSYSGYQGNDYKALPRKVNITRTQDQVKVKVVAKQWKTQ